MFSFVLLHQVYLLNSEAELTIGLKKVIMLLTLAAFCVDSTMSSLFCRVEKVRLLSNMRY